MSTQPTDDEIVALLSDRRYSTIAAVREAIARWGTPATGGGPIGWAYWVGDERDPRSAQFSPYEPTAYANRCKLHTSPQTVREPLNIVELMRVVMKADEESQDTRGTTNWAAHIGKAVQNAVLGITGGQHGTE